MTARDAAVLKAADSTSAGLGRGRRLTLAEFDKNTLHGRERSDALNNAAPPGNPAHAVSQTPCVPPPAEAPRDSGGAERGRVKILSRRGLGYADSLALALISTAPPIAVMAPLLSAT